MPEATFVVVRVKVATEPSLTVTALDVTAYLDCKELTDSWVIRYWRGISGLTVPPLVLVITPPFRFKDLISIPSVSKSCAETWYLKVIVLPLYRAAVAINVCEPKTKEREGAIGGVFNGSENDLLAMSF